MFFIISAVISAVSVVQYLVLRQISDRFGNQNITDLISRCGKEAVVFESRMLWMRFLIASSWKNHCYRVFSESSSRKRLFTLVATWPLFLNPAPLLYLRQTSIPASPTSRWYRWLCCVSRLQIRWFLTWQVSSSSHDEGFFFFFFFVSLFLFFKCATLTSE